MYRFMGLAFVFGVVGAIVVPALADDLDTQKLAASAAADCTNARAKTDAMRPAYEQTKRANDDANAVLAAATEKLHLASLPLQNTDCAGAGKDTAKCVELNAAYDAALQPVRAAQSTATSTAVTFNSYKARFDSAIDGANQLCQISLTMAASNFQDAAANSQLVISVTDALHKAEGLMTSLGIGGGDATTAPTTTAVVAAINGNWASDFGPVVLTSDASGAVSGYWDQDGAGRGVISGGNFADGKLHFHWSQAWNDASGHADFTLSADGKVLAGSWADEIPPANQPKRTGGWTLQR